MRPRITALGLGAVAVLALAATPVAANGAQPVAITLDVDFVGGTETFTADGGFCPVGTAETVDNVRTGGPTGVFHVSKVFTCANGSTLAIDLDAVFQNKRNGTVGGWRVIGGTGDYAGASGGGQINGAGTPTGIIDTYTGVIVR